MIVHPCFPPQPRRHILAHAGAMSAAAILSLIPADFQKAHAMTTEPLAPRPPEPPGSPQAAPSVLEGLSALRPSPRMPVLFVGHGSPLNVIGDNAFRPRWEALGRDFGEGASARWPRPQLILCISAHWITRGWWITGSARPPTIHDFGGFPQALFDQQYPAPGAPEIARDIGQQLKSPPDGQPVRLDVDQWGYDHGSWSVLKPMFPQADTPVLQLSLDYSRPPAEHLALGRQLNALRDRGVLIMGSGNIVHNLRAVQRSAPDDAAYDWAIEFDRHIADALQGRRDAEVADFLKLGDVARLAHPTHDHFLPLLHALGASDARDQITFFNDRFQAASISMRSVIWS